MEKLTKALIEEYFNNYLPYRSRILIAHRNLAKDKDYSGDVSILQACFEASLVTGRMYLNVLGISRNYKDELIEKKFKEDDISATDLGGNLVDIEELPDNEYNLIVGFLKMADKGAAHLTMPYNHPVNETYKAIELIIKLIKEHIYIPVGREMKY